MKIFQHPRFGPLATVTFDERIYMSLDDITRVLQNESSTAGSNTWTSPNSIKKFAGPSRILPADKDARRGPFVEETAVLDILNRFLSDNAQLMHWLVNEVIRGQYGPIENGDWDFATETAAKMDEVNSVSAGFLYLMLRPEPAYIDWIQYLHRHLCAPDSDPEGFKVGVRSNGDIALSFSLAAGLALATRSFSAIAALHIVLGHGWVRDQDASGTVDFQLRRHSGLIPDDTGYVNAAAVHRFLEIMDPLPVWFGRWTRTTPISEGRDYVWRTSWVPADGRISPRLFLSSETATKIAMSALTRPGSHFRTHCFTMLEFAHRNSGKTQKAILVD